MRFARILSGLVSSGGLPSRQVGRNDCNTLRDQIKWLGIFTGTLEKEKVLGVFI